MAEQATGTVEGTGTGGSLARGAVHMEHNPGRAISWSGTGTTILGFVIGGIAFPISNPGPNWVVFWIGAGVALIGLLILLFSNAMNEDWY